MKSTPFFEAPEQSTENANFTPSVNLTKRERELKILAKDIRKDMENGEIKRAIELTDVVVLRSANGDDNK